MHDLQRIVEVTLSPTAQFENIVQPLSIVRGDCNTLRIYIDGLADNSLLYVRFTNGFSCDTYGDTYAAQSDVQTDGEKTYIDVPIPQNKVLWNKSKMQVIASVEKNGCKITTPTTADISTVPDRIINEFLGETGTVTFAQLEAASETATQAAASATSAANAASATATAIAQAAERGDYNGAGIADIQFTAVDEQGGNIYTMTLTNGDTYTFIAPKGDGGAGSGGSGADGFSPIATVEQTTTGATISITDKDGTTTAIITNGIDGADGQDGFSPLASVEQTTTGATITITDKDGETTAHIYNGQDGADGQDGVNGKSAYELAVENGYTETVAEWLASLKGTDGQDGQDGVDGHTPVKGTDYWTTSDKAGMVQDVLDALPTWQGGSY